MNTAKLRGNPDTPPEMTRLKQLWRTSLTEEQKQEILAWRDDAKTTNAIARRQLQELFEVKLSHDGQLSRFWKWISQQEDFQSTSDLLENFEEFVRTRNPEWTPEKVRESGIAFFLAHTMNQCDPSKFAMILSLDQRERLGQVRWKCEERRVSVQEQRLELAKQKQRRDYTEDCMKWIEDAQAQAIAASEAPNAEKIEYLGKLIFGEDW